MESQAEVEKEKFTHDEERARELKKSRPFSTCDHFIHSIGWADESQSVGVSIDKVLAVW